MKQTERLSFNQKNKNNKQWYKDKIDYYDTMKPTKFDYLSTKVNYDLYNNQINIKDFEYVCKPFGNDVGELPASMVNRDIVSSKIKTILGLEMKRPFTYKVLATNSEATTEKEQTTFNTIKQYVIDSIMGPIQEEILLRTQQELQGRELTPEEQQQIQQQIQQEIETRTPEEIKSYMKRKYQSPVEVLSSQLLEYLTQHLDIKNKFNKMFKHLLLSGKGVMYVGILNDEPMLWNVNSLNFNCGIQSDAESIEDAEWATCLYRMTPSQIVRYFSDELSQSDLDIIYSDIHYASETDLFSQEEDELYDNETIPVIHCVWKSLRKIGFLTYIDEQGEPQQILVDESYNLNLDNNDIQLVWKWIPEVYETWKIKTSEPIYVNMRPIPGQFKDLDNLYYSKLPYYGVICDNMNSNTTSLMDRLKNYQYYYDIIMYRIELLLASDKGKKVLMNISAIPDDMKVETWQYYMEATSMMWFNPKEEGKEYQDANTIGRVIDLSLISDIQKYIELAEYVRNQAGKAVGITDQMEGQISQYESVRNVNSSLDQSAYILEPYFNLLEIAKKNILTALIETAKIAYGNGEPKKLIYMLDDFSKNIINVDPALLNNNTLGIFISNNMKTYEIIETIKQLSHAALQNQQATLTDVIKILKQDNVEEMQETLEIAEDKMQKQQMEMQQQQQQHEFEMQQMELQAKQQEFENKKELLSIELTERRKTEIAKVALLGASYNPEQDFNKNNINDFLEIINPDGTINQDVLNIATNVMMNNNAIKKNEETSQDKKQINKQLQNQVKI